MCTCQGARGCRQRVRALWLGSAALVEAADLWQVLVLHILLHDVVALAARVHRHLLVVRKDDDGHLCVAQNGELCRLLDQPPLALCEGDLTVALILDPDDVDLPAAHPLDGSLWVSETQGTRA